MYKNIQLIFIVMIFTATMACSEDVQQQAEQREIITSDVLPQNEVQPEPEPPEEDRALKIGVIGPETGNSAVYGRRILEGILQAARTFNANGGINGQALEVIHYDNKGDPELTEEAVQKLIQQRVVAIFAAPTGWSTFSATHLANSSQTIFIAIGSRRRIGKSGPYIFRVSLADEFAIDELIQYSIKQAGYTNYALVTSSDYDYSLDLSALFRKAIDNNGGQLKLVADTYDTFSGKRNVNSVIKALKKSPEPLHAVIYTGDDKQAAQLARGIKRAGLKLPIIGGEDLHTKSYLRNSKAAARGTLLYASFAPESDSPQVVKFVRDYKHRKKGVPDRFVSLAYDSFMLVAKAIQTAASTKSSVVRDAILNIRHQGVTGETRFSPEGSPVKRPFIYRAVSGKTGEKFILLKNVLLKRKGAQ
jgi:branched-chain amino acid transport system substrate-binding protein